MRYSITPNPLKNDLDHIFQQTREIWEELRGQKIFITGGTGFFGRWLIESLLWIDAHLSLDVKITILTRRARNFTNQAPLIARHSAVDLCEGDIKNFTFPPGRYSHIIHAAATSAYETFHNEDYLAKFDTVVHGTRHTLEFALKCNAKKFLFTSSGAVYGPQPAHMSHIPEEYNGSPDTASIESIWGISKKTAEYLCTYYREKFSLDLRIARCFSFVGPHLPLNLHYAIGNFIRDGIKGGPINILGSGKDQRSYLYISDLTVWLWKILLLPRRITVINVGSEKAYNMEQIAQTVAASLPSKPPVIIHGNSREKKTTRYIPSTAKARKLGLEQTVSLSSAIKKTINFYSQSAQ